jgi:hypothetical protein
MIKKTIDIYIYIFFFWLKVPATFGISLGVACLGVMFFFFLESRCSQYSTL